MNRICLALWLVVSLGGFAAAADPLPSALGRVEPFSLPSVDDALVSMKQPAESRWTVLCFLGTECPLAKLYGPRLQALADRFASDDVRFIGINSNIQDSMDELKQYAADHELSFPIAKDYDRAVAVSAGATRTPEVIVVDAAGAVRYRGRIDDQYEPGIVRAEATKHDLRDAIESLVAGRSVAQPVTEAVGCLISLPRKVDPALQVDAPATYCGDIARVLNQNCIECHRSGEIGPFSLEDYDEVVGWADMSIEVIDNGRMPPWHATDDHAPLANERNMPESDKQLIRDWVAAGMPFGDAADLPPSPTFVDGWQLPRKPDAVWAMSQTPFEVPADGIVEYQYYVVDPGFETDRWVTAAEVIPGNRRAVHHAIAFIRPPDGADFRSIGLLSAYVPGQRRNPLPEGFAQKIPAGSRIVFQMHYTPTGKPETDVTKIGLVFAEASQVTHEVVTLGGINQEFEIPPGAAEFRVDSKMGWFPRDGLLLSIMPHMHLRGKSFRFGAVRSGERETLLEVPAYDFNWQHNYELQEPLALSDIDHLAFTATFDNSADNPTNPDPKEYVTWGDQTWQEMAVTFVAVARPLDSTPVQMVVADENQVDSRAAAESKAKKFADDYVSRFDTNQDGWISQEELPHSVRIFAFRNFDHDGNDQITRDEIAIEAVQRFR